MMLNLQYNIDSLGGVDASTVTQIVTVALAVLAIIWHQQRSTDELRGRLVSVERRFARIDGFLGIGTPGPAASTAPGADLPYKPQQDPETDWLGPE